MSEDEVVSTSSIQLNEELVMLMMARSLRATKCTARRSGERGWLPQVSGDLPRGRSVEHTHTLEEEGEGPPSLSGTNRQRQPGGAPAQAGAQDSSPAEHGQARGGGVKTPQPAGLAQKEGGISPSSTTTHSQSQPTQAHRMPRSPKQQQPPPARRARARAALEEDEVSASREYLVELLHRIDLDLDGNLREHRAHRLECCRNPTCREHVIVLH